MWGDASRSSGARVADLQSGQTRHGGKMCVFSTLQTDGYFYNRETEIRVRAEVRYIDASNRTLACQFTIVSSTGGLARFSIPLSAQRTPLKDVLIKCDGGDVAHSKVVT